MKKIIIISILLLLIAVNVTAEKFSIGALSPSWGAERDPRTWATQNYSADTSFMYQASLGVQDVGGANDTVFFHEESGSGFITHIKVLMQSATAAVNFRHDSVYVYIKEGQDSSRFDLPVPILWASHWNNVNDADIQQQNALQLDTNTISTQTFSTVANFINTTHFIDGSRNVYIPFSDGFKMLFRTTFETAGTIYIYAEVSGIKCSDGEIENLGRFRHLNVTDTVFVVDTDTIGDLGADPHDYQFFNITGKGKGMACDIIHALRATNHGFPNILEDSVYWSPDGLSPERNKSSSKDDWFGGYYYSQWQPPVYGNDFVGRTVYFKDSGNKPHWVYYRKFFPYSPVPFENSFVMGTLIEQFGSGTARIEEQKWWLFHYSEF